MTNRPFRWLFLPPFDWTQVVISLGFLGKDTPRLWSKLLLRYLHSNNFSLVINIPLKWPFLAFIKYNGQKLQKYELVWVFFWTEHSSDIVRYVRTAMYVPFATYYRWEDTTYGELPNKTKKKKNYIYIKIYRNCSLPLCWAHSHFQPYIKRRMPVRDQYALGD